MQVVSATSQPGRAEQGRAGRRRRAAATQPRQLVRLLDHAHSAEQRTAQVLLGYLFHLPRGMFLVSTYAAICFNGNGQSKMKSLLFFVLFFADFPFSFYLLLPRIERNEEPSLG